MCESGEVLETGKVLTMCILSGNDRVPIKLLACRTELLEFFLHYVVLGERLKLLIT